MGYFSQAIKKMISSALYYCGIETNYALRRLSMSRLFQKVADVDGDVVECGVGKMHTFRMLACIMQHEESKKNLWGFDSFEGFPEITAEDESKRNLQKGEWKIIEAEDVVQFFIVLGFDETWIQTRVKIVKGFFSDTLPYAAVSHIAFLHLDVDLYESYKICLRYLFPKVSPGGIVLFDEYNDHVKLPGAKKAVDEYFSGTKYHLKRDALTGKYYVIK